MNETRAYLLLASAILITVILSYIAYRSVQAVQKKRSKNRKNIAQVLADQEKRRDYAQESIRLLTLAAIAQQMGMIEACIRLNGLMDFMAYSEQQREAYHIFTVVSAASSHIPVRDDWEKLSKKAKHRHQQTMLTLENQHHEAITTALERLKGENFLLDQKAQQPIFYPV